jgi:hypothetical protein
LAEVLELEELSKERKVLVPSRREERTREIFADEETEMVETGAE